MLNYSIFCYVNMLKYLHCKIIGNKGDRKKMFNVHIFGIELFDIFYNFFIYSFLGWIYESCYVSIRKKAWVNRGFLNGPVIPIYGAGATLVYMFLWQFRYQYLFIFFGGMLLASFLEYFTSLFMELLFHAKWWDYSNMKFNIEGRISLGVSIFWGFLSLVMIEVLQPGMVKILNWIPNTWGTYLSIVIFALFSSDLILTVIHTVKLEKMLGDLQKFKQDFSDYIESTKLFETKEEWKIKLSSYKMNDLLENIKSFFEENKEKLTESNKYIEGFEIKKYKVEIEKHVKEYICKFQTRTSMTSYVQRRLLKAFPNVQFMKREDSLKDLKERLQKYKVK